MSDFTFFWAIGFLFFVCRPVSALLLPECARNVSRTPAVCCPIPEGYKTACGFPVRGICRRTQAFKEPVIEKLAYQFKHDARIHWPHRVFQYSCECIGRFWGQDCGECWYGYEGRNCQYRAMYTRRRADTMTKTQKKKFVDVLTKAATLPSRYVVPSGIQKNGRLQGPWKKTNIIERLAFLHWFAGSEFVHESDGKCKKIPSSNTELHHGPPNSLLFNRLLTLEWEKEMQKVGRKYFDYGNWTWPYFDWTNKRKCDVCTDDLVGSETRTHDSVSGDHRLSPQSPFHKWTAYCSSLHRSACSSCYHSEKTVYIARNWANTKLPRASDVRRILQMPLFYNLSSLCYSFSHMLESGENCHCNSKNVKLHAAAGPSDPLFFLHHVNIDRLFARWFKRVRPSTFEMPSFHAKRPGGCRQCSVIGKLPSISNEDLMTDTESLGYIYEDLDFGPVKAREEIASPHNVYIAPMDRGCPATAKPNSHQHRK